MSGKENQAKIEAKEEKLNTKGSKEAANKSEETLIIGNDKLFVLLLVSFIITLGVAVYFAVHSM